MTRVRWRRAIDSPYVVLSAILLALMVSRTVNGIWGGDFWEHAAAVRELATHPLEPRHPLFASAAPNAFFSPYSLVVAVVGRGLDLGPIAALSAAGIANLLLLLIGLFRFTRTLSDARRTPFLALLFILFLWGPAPWLYSGFFHFEALGYVLPYPSTFAAALVLLGTSSTVRYLRDRNRGSLAGLLVMTTLILLTHPLSAIVLGVAVVSVALGTTVGDERDFRRTTRLLATLGAIGLVAGGIATLWPYYPFLALLTREGAAFHESNQPIYEGLLGKTWPALIGVVPLFARLKSNRLDPLVLMFLGLGSIYAYGWLTEQWSYGRVASFMVMIPQIALAQWVATEWHRAPRPRKAAIAGGLAVFVFLAVRNFHAAFTLSLPERESNYRQYRFLAEHTRQYDVVLANPATSWFVPTFGGKVVANRSMAFIEDRAERLADVDRFFDSTTSTGERLGILAKYRVDYVLLDRANPIEPASVVASLGSWGKAVYDDDRFILIKRVGGPV